MRFPRFARFSYPILAVSVVLSGCGGTVTMDSKAPAPGTGPVPTVIAVGEQVNGVAPNRKQEVQFSEAMDPATINTQTFQITDSTGKLMQGTVSYDSNFNTASFLPNPALQMNANYTVTITTGVASSGGMHLATPYTFTFDTRSTTDTSPISVNAVSPTANATCVSASTPITITFDEAPDASTLTAANLTVTGPSGAIAVKISTNVTTTQVVLTPTSPLPSGAITVTVNHVADLAGVAMTAPYTWNFSTACGGGGGSGGGSGGLQVMYVLNHTTLTTYDIDPQTLQATEAGSITVPSGSYPNLIAAPDDHFIYYSANQGSNSNSASTTWVYATDNSGAPQEPATQLNAPSPQMNPNGTLAYAVTAGAITGPSGNQTTPYQIVSFQRDPVTGQFGNSQVQATYNLQTNVGGLYCGLLILGFSPMGDELYDEPYCTAPLGAPPETINQRSVDLTTGMLGPDVEIYKWNPSSEGAPQLVANLIFEFVKQNQTLPVPTSGYIDVYPLQPNSTTPLIHCTASMQQICGTFTGRTSVHPSGQYVFLNDESLVTQILRVDVSTGQLVATGSTIPYAVQTLSPDGSLVYGRAYASTGVYIQIYGFNASDGSLVPGGSIFVPSSAEIELAAQRH